MNTEFEGAEARQTIEFYNWEEPIPSYVKEHAKEYQKTKKIHQNIKQQHYYNTTKRNHNTLGIHDIK